MSVAACWAGIWESACLPGETGFAEDLDPLMETNFRGAGYNDTFEDHGSHGWNRCGVVYRSRLLAGLADRATLTAELAEGLAVLRKPRARHDLGRVLIYLAVAVADGATTISDIAVLGDHVELFGSAASDSTCWRLLDRMACQNSPQVW